MADNEYRFNKLIHFEGFPTLYYPRRTFSYIGITECIPSNLPGPIKFKEKSHISKTCVLRSYELIEQYSNSENQTEESYQELIRKVQQLVNDDSGEESDDDETLYAINIILNHHDYHPRSWPRSPNMYFTGTRAMQTISGTEPIIERRSRSSRRCPKRAIPEESQPGEDAMNQERYITSLPRLNPKVRDIVKKFEQEASRFKQEQAKELKRRNSMFELRRRDQMQDQARSEEFRNQQAGSSALNPALGRRSVNQINPELNLEIEIDGEKYLQATDRQIQQFRFEVDIMFSNIRKNGSSKKIGKIELFDVEKYSSRNDRVLITLDGSFRLLPGLHGLVPCLKYLEYSSDDIINLIEIINEIMLKYVFIEKDQVKKQIERFIRKYISVFRNQKIMTYTLLEIFYNFILEDIILTIVLQLSREFQEEQTRFQLDPIRFTTDQIEFIDPQVRNYIKRFGALVVTDFLYNYYIEGLVERKRIITKRHMHYYYLNRKYFLDLIWQPFKL